MRFAGGSPVWSSWLRFRGFGKIPFPFGMAVSGEGAGVGPCWGAFGCAVPFRIASAAYGGEAWFEDGGEGSAIGR